MVNKVEVLMHPVRMKISQALMRNKENGLTPLEMVKVIKDVPQATLYRHIQTLLDAGIIRILKEEKVKAVSEKYYTLNEEQLKVSSKEWKELSSKEKLDYFSYYQLSLTTQYQNFLHILEEKNADEDLSTFSLAELKLKDTQFINFQTELNELIMKYSNITNENKEKDVPFRTVAITIIPES
ncbi:helix-turn-helix domain-containing protein [Metabacillus fastidiosus]|uniref:helix-turn-helix domain-containing protein n=1 Tax=Metabacillus fastidiosus TaxID=1458 RepID=UPI002DB896D9|nr:helix-turn-helix domain-containing protein [Metabacillus fastidiosus]MEC2075294.1 helix-turn-helix domain-containing protein [Metabacillus fastidiosus]